jgi:hypothetical protein
MKAEELVEKLMNNTGKTVKVVNHTEDGIPYTIDIDEVKIEKGEIIIIPK